MRPSRNVLPFLVNLPVFVLASLLGTADGAGALTCSLMPGLPNGLSFDANIHMLTGTPMAAASAMYTYTAADSGDPGKTTTLAFTIAEEDQALPVVSVAAVTSPVTGGNPAVFTLTREGATTTSLTVRLSVTGDTNLVSGPLPTEVIFGVGEATSTLSIPTRDDTEDEADGTITVTVAPMVTDYVVGSGTAEVIVADNDLPVVFVAEGASFVVEGNPVVFTLIRVGSTTTSLTVSLLVTGDTDFVSGSLPTEAVFRVGEATTTLRIPTLDDEVDEAHGLIAVTVVPMTDYLVGGGSTEITVLDDDLPLVSVAAALPAFEGEDVAFMLTRVGVTAGRLEVRLEVTAGMGLVSGPLPTAATFDFDEETTTLRIPMRDNEVDEADGMIRVTLTAGSLYVLSEMVSGTGAVKDNDLPSITSFKIGDFTAQIDEQADPKTITVTVSGETSLTGVTPVVSTVRPGATLSPPGAVTFLAGTATPFGVSAGGDTETYQVTVEFTGSPTGLAVFSALASTTLVLGWTSPSDTSGAAILGYKIERSEDGMMGWQEVSANTCTTDTRYSHEDLTIGETIHYRVSAISSVGPSTPSGVAWGTVGSAPTVTFGEPVLTAVGVTAPMTPNMRGRIHYVVLGANDRAPVDLAGVKGSRNWASAGVVVVGVSQLVEVSGLEAFTDYVLYGVLSDVRDGALASAPVAQLRFRTAVAPTATFGVPASTAAGFRVDVTSNVAGRLHYVVVERVGAAVPGNLEQVRALFTSGAVSSSVAIATPGVSQSIEIVSGLMASTEYVLYGVVSDSGGVALGGAGVSELRFTTAAAPTVTFGEPVLTAVGFRVEATSNVAGWIYFVVVVVEDGADGPVNLDALRDLVDHSVSAGLRVATVGAPLLIGVVSRLKASTPYDLYAVVSDFGEALEGALVSELRFTTAPAPAVTFGVPESLAVGVRVDATPNTIGKIHYVVMEAGEEVPSSELDAFRALGALVSSSVERVNTAQPITILGLTALTDYELYAVLSDAGNKALGGAVMKMVSFRTLESIVSGDRAVLVALYEANGGSSWDNSEGWSPTPATDTNHLHGVTVTVEGRVSRLDLSNNNLVGALLPELADLTALTHLSLSGNFLSGTIPAELGSLGPLTHLDLGGNFLSGVIPSQLGQLGLLARLDLGFNSLSGSIPSELGDLRGLTDLHLGANFLSGTIPPSLGQLSELTNLWLYSNDLTGAIPSELGALGRLRILSVSRNNLSDIPDLNSLAGHLTRFDVDFNFFEFDDLERNEGIVTQNEGQQKLGMGGVVDGAPGDDITLSFDIGGSANIYAWKRDGSPTEGNTSTLQISGYDAGMHAGVYVLEITSRAAPGVTLRSKPRVVGADTPVPMFGGLKGGRAETEACGHLFRDDGGKFSYEDIGDTTLTLKPETDQQQVRVEFTSFDTREGRDILRAYHGSSPEEAFFIQAYSGDLENPVLASQSLDGALTFHFSPFSRSFIEEGLPGGWEALVTCPTRPPPAIELSREVVFSGFDDTDVGTLSVSNAVGATYTFAFAEGGDGGGKLKIVGDKLKTATALVVEVVSITVKATGSDILEPLTKEFEIRSISPPIREDIDALVSLHSATAGSSWRNSSGWPPSEDKGASIYGVTVEGGRVTGLDLSGNDLSGTLPSKLGQLTGLTSLDLGGNTLSGTIPSELSLLVELKTLSLRLNRLSGSIPPELEDLSALTSLDLGINFLSGSIPVELGELSMLTELDLCGNTLGGPIPPVLGDLGALTSLDLSSNSLSGSIPIELGSLGSLTDLNLGGNPLGGSIPGELGDLGNLTSLDLRNGSLDGSIPSALMRLTGLTYLDLGGNALHEEIPSELGQLNALEYLDLGNNSLSGSIPSELLVLSGLKTLDVSRNNFKNLPDLGSAPGDYPTGVDLNFNYNFNYFEFDDLNNYISSTGPGQRRLGEGGLVEGVTGGAITLSFDIEEGASNSYAWMKDGLPVQAGTMGVSGEGATDLTITSYDATRHSGVYELHISNSVVEGAPLVSKPKVIGSDIFIPMYGGATGEGIEIEACGRGFMDGGGEGDYGHGRDITMTLAPRNDQERVRVTFNSFATQENRDILRVYHGKSADGSFLRGSYSGVFAPEALDLASTSLDGSLTFRFISDERYSTRGWEARVECPMRPVVELGSRRVSAGYEDAEVGVLTVPFPDGVTAFNFTSDGNEGEKFKIEGDMLKTNAVLPAGMEMIRLVGTDGTAALSQEFEFEITVFAPGVTLGVASVTAVGLTVSATPNAVGEIHVGVQPAGTTPPGIYWSWWAWWTKSLLRSQR